MAAETPRFRRRWIHTPHYTTPYLHKDIHYDYDDDDDDDDLWRHHRKVSQKSEARKPSEANERYS